VTTGLPFRDGELWNTMIAPLGTFQGKGVLWYQGESNIEQVQYYKCQFPLFIRDWRALAGQSELFFFIVELTPFTEFQDSTVHLPHFREAQAELAEMISEASLVSAFDLGDYFSPFGNIHPREKQLIGLRASMAALTLLYDKNYDYYGPVLDHIELMFQDAYEITLLLVYELNSVVNGLTLVDSQCPDQSLNCEGFSVQLTNFNWTAGNPEIIPHDNSAILLKVPISDPEDGVRVVQYAYCGWPLSVLYNSQNFPALPFRYEFNSKLEIE
jgi:sialate O-acetylesterase